MDTTDIIKKIEEGTATEADMGSLIDSMTASLAELKERDPAAYLKSVKELNAAVVAMNETLSIK